MKVAVAPHAYAPSIGGAENYAKGLAEGLAARGHEVQVLVADIRDPEAFYELGHTPVGVGDEIIGGVAVRRIPYFTIPYRLLGGAGVDRAVQSARKRFDRGLQQELGRLDPDVVLTLPHLFPNVQSVMRLRASAHWRLVYAPMLHETDPNWSIVNVAAAVERADGIIALTDHERDRLITSYGADPASTVVISPGVDVPRGDRSRRARDPIVLFLGRRTSSKRLDVLHDAMKDVWVEHPEARLVIAGSPPHTGADPAAAISSDNRVVLIDRPGEDEKSELLDSALVLVSVSETESFGITTLEAWAHGLPVIVADNPVNRAVVRDGIDGILVAPERSSLALVLTQLLNEPDGGVAMGARGRDRAVLGFSWETASRKLEDLASELRIRAPY